MTNHSIPHEDMSHISPNELIASVSRRQSMKIGMLGGLGVGLADMLRLEANASPLQGVAGRAKSVILLWLQGGLSHHDTFDMKPETTEEIRGEFMPIPTNLPGYHVSELMPKLARCMDKMAVIRSMTHKEAAHQRGCMYMVEGRQPPKATGVEASGHPHLGSVVSHLLGNRNGLPAYVSIPGNDFTSRFVGTGFLPVSCASFKQTQVKSLSSAGTQMTPERLSHRVQLLRSLDTGIDTARQRFGDAWDQFSEQAIDIVTSGKAAAAFDINQEPQSVRDAYGANGKNQIGDLCLRARRLVEAGVRFVTVGRNSWDHHSNIFSLIRGRLPRNDQAIAALLNDLSERGMLDDTLVILASEFGRTPKVNKTAGRDHWPRVFSIALSGAGIGMGQVIGASDKIGSDPIDDPVSPEELAATILHLVGINPQTTVYREGIRPAKLVDEAKPFQKLLA